MQEATLDAKTWPPNIGSTISSSPASHPVARPPGASRWVHSRSCTLCRSRKVKCDKQQPCVNCVRACAECVYPPGPGRAPKRPRKGRDAQLLDRLSKLESIIKRLDEDNVQAPDGPNMDKEAVAEPDIALAGDGEPGAERRRSDSGTSTPVEKQLGRLVVNEGRSYYVSNVLWARIGDEIEELRDLLHEKSSDDEPQTPVDDSLDNSPASGLDCNAMLMGFRAVSHSLQDFHPPLSQSVALLEMFRENVAPLVCIFHVPTLIRQYWDAVASLDTLDKNTEALLFAIYYSAIISMDSSQCLAKLGIDRPAALERYLFAVQQAFARADLLNTQNLILIQAAVLFLSALRNEDDTRRVWSLTALIFHIAQAMGLHRDGGDYGLRPLEIELRRRLWWHICLLDHRSSDYHGCEPIASDSVFDTNMPLNINDSDISADMTHPPAEREGATEMTLCLIRCHSLRVMWKIGYIPPGHSAGPTSKAWGKAGQPMTQQDQETTYQELKQLLEDRYIRYCDPSIPFQLISATVARHIITRTWLMMYYPRTQNIDNGRQEAMSASSTDLREQLFLTAVQVLEMSSYLFVNDEFRRYRWHMQTHLQWHTLAIVLAELCRRPPSADCDRAWVYINTLSGRWDLIKDSDKKKGALWRPMQRLIAKARYVREIQTATMASMNSMPTRAQQGGIEGAVSGTLATGGSDAFVPVPFSTIYGSASFQGGSMTDQQGFQPIYALDPMMDLAPDVNFDPLGSLAEEEDIFQFSKFSMF